MAILDRHLEIANRQAEARPAMPHELARRFLDCGRALSEREAAVAAALLLGKTQREISAATGIALSSVITYRRRAYRKLCVSDRRGLADFLPALDQRH